MFVPLIVVLVMAPVPPFATDNVPLSDDASTPIVISDNPSNETPLINLAVVNLVAVDALPKKLVAVTLPDPKFPELALIAPNDVLPLTVKLPNVPKPVNDELVIFEANTDPVRFNALTVLTGIGNHVGVVPDNVNTVPVEPEAIKKLVAPAPV